MWDNAQYFGKLRDNPHGLLGLETGGMDGVYQRPCCRVYRIRPDSAAGTHDDSAPCHPHDTEISRRSSGDRTPNTGSSYSHTGQGGSCPCSDHAAGLR